LVGAEPVAAGLLGVAGVAKGVQGIASGVSAGARAVEKMGGALDKGASVADHTAHAIQDIRRGKSMKAVGNVVKAVEAGEQVGKSVSESRKQIQRIRK
jgi:methyl-accepting chemotaxis protein